MNEKTIHYLAGELQVSGSDTPIDEALIAASDLIKQLRAENERLRERLDCVNRVFGILLSGHEWLKENGGAPGAWQDNQIELIRIQRHCIDSVMEDRTNAN